MEEDYIVLVDGHYSFYSNEQLKLELKDGMLSTSARVFKIDKEYAVVNELTLKLVDDKPKTYIVNKGDSES